MRVAAFSNLPCAGGTLLRQLGKWEKLQFSERLNGEGRATITFPLGEASGLILGVIDRVLQIQDDDGQVFEYRVQRSSDQADASQPFTVEARPVLWDLQRPIISIELNGEQRYVITANELTPEQWIDNYVLPVLAAAGMTWIAKGTITPTAPITLTLDHDTPLSLLRQLVAGTLYDVVLRRNGTTNYLIDLVELNIAVTKPTVWLGKNIIMLDRQVGEGEFITAVKPTGLLPDNAVEKATVAETVLKVTARASSTVTLVDPRDSGDALAGDDHLNGQYLAVPVPYGVLANAFLGNNIFGPRSVYNPLKDRMYIFSSRGAFYGFECSASIGEVLTYLDNDVFGNISGLIDAVYVPVGGSGTIWLWTLDGAILALDCSSHTIATVKASGAVAPGTRPYYHAGQDAVYYVGTDVPVVGGQSTIYKLLATTPFTQTTYAIGSQAFGMEWVNSQSKFYLTRLNAAGPHLRTFDPAGGGTFANITVTGGADYFAIGWDSGQDRVFVAVGNNSSRRVDVINPSTNAITDTIEIPTVDEGDTAYLYTGLGPGMGWGSLAAAGTVWFNVGAGGTRSTSTGINQPYKPLRVVGINATTKVATIYRNGFLNLIASPTRILGYDSGRGRLMIHSIYGWFGLEPQHNTWSSIVQVSDTADPPGTVTVAARPSLFDPGAFVTPVENTDGKRMTVMRHTGLIAANGFNLKVEDLPSGRGERNLIRDPFLKDWFSTKWPKFLHHCLDQSADTDGVLLPIDHKVVYSEYPTTGVTEHAFEFDGAQTVNPISMPSGMLGADSVTLKNGPINTIIPAGSWLENGASPGPNAYNTTRWQVVRRAVTNGSGSVTLVVSGGFSATVGDGDDCIVRVMGLGGTGAGTEHTLSPTGMWLPWLNTRVLGRWFIIPSAIPSPLLGDEYYAVRMKFGGHFKRYSNPGLGLSQMLTVITPDGANVAIEGTEVVDGIHWWEVIIRGRARPGLYFAGVNMAIDFPSAFYGELMLVMDSFSVMYGVEPGTTAVAPVAEYSHANALWRVGKEILEQSTSIPTSYKCRVLDKFDPSRPFLLGSKADVRDPRRNIFIQTPRITGRDIEVERLRRGHVRVLTLELDVIRPQLTRVTTPTETISDPGTINVPADGTPGTIPPGQPGSGTEPPPPPPGGTGSGVLGVDLWLRGFKTN